MEEQIKQGKFFNNLRKSNKEIKESRALSIAEDAELMFKRKVENLHMDLKRKKRERENMLDLSPTNTTSLILAEDFSAEDWVNRYTSLGLEVRNLEIKLDIAEDSYNELFEEEIKRD